MSKFVIEMDGNSKTYGGCVKCVRTARAVGDILDLMRSQ